MNFNFNNQRTKFHLAPPIMRHFSTIGLVTTKPEPSESLLKPEYLFKNVPNNFFSTFPGNVLPNKSFSNPNFVNKNLTPNIGTFKLSNDSYTQPIHDNYTKKEEMVHQSLPDKLSSQNSPQLSVHKPETENSPKSVKKIRNRRKNRKNRQKICETEQKSNMTAKKNNKKNCSSPKRCKKESKKCKKDKKDLTPEKEGFCLQIKSSPIEISPNRSFTISISPCSEFLKNISSSNSSSEKMSCSPSSPAIRRLRMPSECDSEDSFIVFCDDISDCFTGNISSEESFDEDTDSDFELDFKEKTDLNRSPKKKVTFATDETLCTVHPMIQWGYAYHAARRGPWEELARDRSRFETRISNTGHVLNKILDPKHRARVYQQRFQDN